MSLVRPRLRRRRPAGGGRRGRAPEGQPPRPPRVACASTARRREIVATAPSPRRLAEAAAFARERADWIAERLAELPRRRAARARA